MALVRGFVVFDGGDRLIEAAGVLEHAALLAGGLVVVVFLLAHCAPSLFVVDAGGLDFDAGVRLVEGAPPCEWVACAAFAPSSGAYDFVVGLDEVGVKMLNVMLI